jgi:hypothetical protein
MAIHTPFSLVLLYRCACYGTWPLGFLPSARSSSGSPSISSLAVNGPGFLPLCYPHTASVDVVTWLCRLESGSLSSLSSAVAPFAARPSSDALPELPLHLSRASHNCVVAEWASLRTRRVPLCDHLQSLRVSASYAASDRSFRQCSCLERRLTGRSSSRRTSAILLRLGGHQLALTAARCYIFQPFTLPHVVPFSCSLPTSFKPCQRSCKRIRVSDNQYNRTNPATWPAWFTTPPFHT